MHPSRPPRRGSMACEPPRHETSRVRAAYSQTEEPDRIHAHDRLLFGCRGAGQLHNESRRVVDVVPRKVGSEEDALDPDFSNQVDESSRVGGARRAQRLDDLAKVEVDRGKVPRETGQLAPRGSAHVRDDDSKVGLGAQERTNSVRLGVLRPTAARPRVRENGEIELTARLEEWSQPRVTEVELLEDRVELDAPRAVVLGHIP